MGSSSRRTKKSQQNQEPVPEQTAAGTDSAEPARGRHTTFVGRLLLFLIIPSVMGMLGLYIAQLQSKTNPSRKVSFDNDFIMPFLLTVALGVVVMIQTGGFRSKMKPLLQWPKVRRARKIATEESKKND